MTRRARVSGRHKMGLVAQAMVAALLPARAEHWPAIPPARPLIAAVTLPPLVNDNLDSRLARNIHLLACIDTRPRRFVPRRAGRLAAAK